MKKLLNRAMAILAKRDHSEYELRRKLAAQFSFNSSNGFNSSGTYQKKSRRSGSSLSENILESEKILSKEELSEQIESVIQYCYEYHWLDDRKFADSFIRIRSSKGYGPQRIQAELQHKGVNKDIIYSALADCEIDWVELAHKLVVKQFNNRHFSDWKSKSKAYNYLVYRGFYSDDVNEALKKAAV